MADAKLKSKQRSRAALTVHEVSRSPKEVGRGKTTRVFFFARKETLAEQLINRHHRPHRLYRELLPEVGKRLGIDVSRARWSQTAGCRCPCSPGFILPKDHGPDVAVVVTGAGAKVEASAGGIPPTR